MFEVMGALLTEKEERAIVAALVSRPRRDAGLRAALCLAPAPPLVMDCVVGDNTMSYTVAAHDNTVIYTALVIYIASALDVVRSTAITDAFYRLEVLLTEAALKSEHASSRVVDAVIASIVNE